ncbi:HD domain-containing protein [Prosthecomicrobium sp. N25]|uniref:HD domain-containing protein n=1 Tax=Prosthecomicrobium sp. N25 TaxID=3129254 RepID=UPI0030788F51
MPNDALLITRAVHFAAVHHKDQHRKGADHDPYMNHLAEVAAYVATADAAPDAEVIAAAYLHDTIEDTAVSHEDLVHGFGRRVADIVAEVTDDKSLPKDERKRLQIEHAPTLSREARLIKIADKTSNVRSLVHAPPEDWPHERLVDYVAWARQVVDRIRGTDARLEDTFDRIAAETDRRFADGPSSAAPRAK